MWLIKKKKKKKQIKIQIIFPRHELLRGLNHHIESQLSFSLNGAITHAQISAHVGSEG